MINQYMLEPFARAYHPISDAEHHIAEEFIDTSHRLRHRVGVRLISIGQHLSSPEPQGRMAA